VSRGDRNFRLTMRSDIHYETSGHIEAVDPAVPPSCTTSGKTEGKSCPFCDVVYVAQTTVPATGHTSVADAARAPTCTETGFTAGSHCSVCNKVLTAQTELPATGHSYAEAVFNWSEDLTAAAAVFACHCGDEAETACALDWDDSAAGRLVVTASAVFEEETFRESKEITYSVQGETITVTLPGEISGLQVFAATYGGNGQMTGIIPVEISGNVVSLPSSADRIRIFFITSDYRSISLPVVL